MSHHHHGSGLCPTCAAKFAARLRDALGRVEREPDAFSGAAIVLITSGGDREVLVEMNAIGDGEMIADVFAQLAPQLDDMDDLEGTPPLGRVN